MNAPEPSPPAGEPLVAELDRIVEFPWEVLEYLAWLRQQPSSREGTRSYLFDAPRVRFSPVDTDLLVAEPGAAVRTSGSVLELVSARAPSGVAIDGLGAAERGRVEALLQRLDGQSPLAVLRANLDPASAGALEALLRAAFGNLIFAPLAVMTAERAISGVEVTRFPGSPYEVARAYWTNMGAVRARTGALFAALDRDDDFARELRKLHVVLLMGEDLQSYYQPASPISSGRAAPGRFMLTPAQTVDAAGTTLFVSGPRVAAAPVGGARYHELLDQSLGPGASDRPAGSTEAALDWGRVVHARAATDAASAPWFCPPRPLRREHLRSLRETLALAERAARSADRARCVDALAAFHQDFVRLHPFHCGNQSLAMNLVNGVLLQALGAGMPHLILDHLALRLSREAYVRLFRRAVAAYVDPGPSVAARYLRLASNRTRTFELLRQIDAAPTLEAARELTRADATSTRLLLLSDE